MDDKIIERYKTYEKQISQQEKCHAHRFKTHTHIHTHTTSLTNFIFKKQVKIV